MKAIVKLIKDILTGIDGESYDYLKLACVATIATYLFSAVWDLVKNKHFDAQAFGIGAGAILSLSAWGVHIKSSTEPGAPDGSKN